MDSLRNTWSWLHLALATTSLLLDLDLATILGVHEQDAS